MTTLSGLDYVCRLEFRFHDLIRYPSTTGRRVAWSIAEGRAEGPRLSAAVADNGGELVVIRPDGTLDLDSRMMLRLDDGRLIYWRAKGTIATTPEAATVFAEGGALAPSPIVVSPYFDTPPDALTWMTRAVFVGRGEVSDQGGFIELYALSAEEIRHA